jgi:hypothetical protein
MIARVKEINLLRTFVGDSLLALSTPQRPGLCGIDTQ